MESIYILSGIGTMLKYYRYTQNTIQPWRPLLHLAPPTPTWRICVTIRNWHIYLMDAQRMGTSNVPFSQILSFINRKQCIMSQSFGWFANRFATWFFVGSLIGCCNRVKWLTQTWFPWDLWMHLNDLPKERVPAGHCIQSFPVHCFNRCSINL